MKKPLLLLVLCFKLSFCLSQSARFYAETDAAKVPLGAYIEVKFILENSDGKSFVPPRFEGFEIIAGPNRSSSMSIVNGKVSKTMSYSFSIRPKRIGRLSIGQSSIISSVGRLFTDEISIEVVKAEARSIDNPESVFIETICSDTSAYVGQQIILTYKLYARLNVQSISFPGKEEYEGFFSSDISSNSEPTKREMINGQEYATKIIKRISLFPQQKGYYTIDPTMAVLGIANENTRRRFFFSSQLDRKQVMAKGVSINVIETPSPAPLSYSGAIGSYKMNAELFKKNITTDDAIVVTMLVTGDGDSKTVNPPTWISTDSLEVYDPNILSDEIISKRRKISHRKEFEYLLVPKYPGKYILKPEFSYFDVDSQDYIKLEETLPVINVLAGNRYKQQKTDALDQTGLELVHDPHLSKRKNRLHGNLLHSIFLLIVFLLASSIVSYSIYLKRSGKLDPVKIKRERAYSLALERLNKLSELLSQDKASLFYLELITSVKKFLSDKFQIPAFHISRNEIIEALKESPLEDSDIEEIGIILSEAETALYAPGMVKSPDELYDQTLELFTRIES